MQGERCYKEGNIKVSRSKTKIKRDILAALSPLVSEEQLVLLGRRKVA